MNSAVSECCVGRRVMARRCSCCRSRRGRSSLRWCIYHLRTTMTRLPWLTTLMALSKNALSLFFTYSVLSHLLFTVLFYLLLYFIFYITVSAFIPYCIFLFVYLYFFYNVCCLVFSPWVKTHLPLYLLIIAFYLIRFVSIFPFKEHIDYLCLLIVLFYYIFFSCLFILVKNTALFTELWMYYCIYILFCCI